MTASEFKWLKITHLNLTKDPLDDIIYVFNITQYMVPSAQILCVTLHKTAGNLLQFARYIGHSSMGDQGRWVDGLYKMPRRIGVSSFRPIVAQFTETRWLVTSSWWQYPWPWWLPLLQQLPPVTPSVPYFGEYSYHINYHVFLIYGTTLNRSMI